MSKTTNGEIKTNRGGRGGRPLISRSYRNLLKQYNGTYDSSKAGKTRNIPGGRWVEYHGTFLRKIDAERFKDWARYEHGANYVRIFKSVNGHEVWLNE